MKIIKAHYHDKDVTDVVKSLTVNGKIDIDVGNHLFGDPAVGMSKVLTISYETENKEYLLEAEEGHHVSLPPSKNQSLAIFYTNNNKEETKDTIDFSLNRIKVASEGKVDILTSVWHPIAGNPFRQYQSALTTGGHLNQVLQILQLLYQAARTKNYKYVSFLEHDVLYPEGYFDYPEFEKGNVLTNMNYIGLCESGWQKRDADHEPLSQMTMTFDDAIEHFGKIFANALTTNSGLLENQDLTRIQWKCENPAVHVNHGHHFTSHYTIYSRENFDEVNPYWGHKENYSYLFFDKEASDKKKEEAQLAREKTRLAKEEAKKATLAERPEALDASKHN